MGDRLREGIIIDRVNDLMLQAQNLRKDAQAGNDNQSVPSCLVQLRESAYA